MNIFNKNNIFIFLKKSAFIYYTIIQYISIIFYIVDEFFNSIEFSKTNLI